jgi:hypothetical protein
VYGPGDPSALGKYLELFLSGRMRMMMFPETGLNLAHVDDIADGFLLIHDKEGIGESYALGGEIATNRGLIEALGRIVGRKPPRQSMPVGLVKLSIPLGPVIGKLMNQGPNLRELISTADGVTFWFSDGKARRELGYTPRTWKLGFVRRSGPRPDGRGPPPHPVPGYRLSTERADLDVEATGSPSPGSLTCTAWRGTEGRAWRPGCYSITTRGWPVSTTSPLDTRTSDTVPSWVAAM